MHPTNPGGSQHAVAPFADERRFERSDAVLGSALIAGGASLAVYGLVTRGLRGLGTALLGGTVAYAGFRSIGPARRVSVERTLTIGRPRGEVYAAFRRFEDLPRTMTHLESVTDLGGGRSHWAARPVAGSPPVEWDAEVVEEREGELLTWRSVEGCPVRTAGHVCFAEGPGGTRVHVIFDYQPPVGPVGRPVAALLSRALGAQIEQDLRRFKAFVESGECPTIAGQPRGDAGHREPAESRGDPGFHGPAEGGPAQEGTP